MSEKKVISKKDWISSFNLIGRPILNDYTFKIDEHSEKSNWVYNALNLGIDTGERSGTVYCELMGGYSASGENKIFAHGKKDDGSDDFEQSIVVDFEDRFNEDVLEEIGDLSFLTVGLEKTSQDKTYYKKFLSAYDAIAYIKDHLSEDMVVNVKGNLKYSTYNDVVQVRKNITSIALSKVDNSANFKATFTQSVLIDKDSASLKNIDKDKGVVYVDARVLDYVKEINGVEVKGQYPFNKQFEYAMDFSKEDKCKKIMEKLFKVKKDTVTQINFEGELIESGAVIQATLDDLPDDIRELVEIGVYSEEEACAKCTANGNKQRRMVFTAPQIKLVGEEKTPVVSVFPERYMENDLTLDYLYDNKKNDDNEEAPFDTEEESDGDGDGLDWLNAL